MIHVDHHGDGRVRVWRREPASGQWQLVARGLTELAALVDAEQRIRTELTIVQERLHQAKQAERR